MLRIVRELGIEHAMITCTFEDGNHVSLRHVVVHAIVEKAGKILLVRRALRLLEGGKWSLPSGFMDRDETANQCIERELLEETGWKGNAGQLFRIITRPDRPHEDRQNVALEYLVTPVERVGTPDDESIDLSWVPVDALPAAEDMAFDHGESLSLYLSYRSGNLRLPLCD